VETSNGRPLRILIADDHETVRKGISAILSSRGSFEMCGEAANGIEAIAKAKELKPDLIVLDITMPELGGFEAAKVIRKLYPDMHILFLSMHDGKHLIEAAKSIPVQGFVVKNQVAQTLIDAVEEVRKGNAFFPTFA
jgi:two-component system, NarL family, nitrate/nitrite response regulator NarL